MSDIRPLKWEVSTDHGLWYVSIENEIDYTIIRLKCLESNREIEMDPEEWPTLKKAIEIAIKQIEKNNKE